MDPQANITKDDGTGIAKHDSMTVNAKLGNPHSITNSRACSVTRHPLSRDQPVLQF
jgi:hypothetical protein